MALTDFQALYFVSPLRYESVPLYALLSIQSLINSELLIGVKQKTPPYLNSNIRFEDAY